MLARRRTHNSGQSLEDVQKLRRDVDLGMRMAERLTAMGETGAAAAIVGELVRETDALIQSLPVAPPRRRLSRSSVVGLSVAVALGAGSAAAIVGTPEPIEAERRQAPESTTVHLEPARKAPPLLEPVPDATSQKVSGSVPAPKAGDDKLDADAPSPGDGPGSPPDGGWPLPFPPPDLPPAPDPVGDGAR